MWFHLLPYFLSPYCRSCKILCLSLYLAFMLVETVTGCTLDHGFNSNKTQQVHTKCCKRRAKNLDAQQTANNGNMKYSTKLFYAYWTAHTVSSVVI